MKLAVRALKRRLRESIAAWGKNIFEVIDENAAVSRREMTLRIPVRLPHISL
jgi:hypothetical protein